MSVKFFKLCDSIRMIHSILQIAKFLPGESHGQRRLGGYSSRGCRELDMVQQLSMHACTMSCCWRTWWV